MIMECSPGPAEQQGGVARWREVNARRFYVASGEFQVYAAPVDSNSNQRRTREGLVARHVHKAEHPVVLEV